MPKGPRWIPAYVGLGANLEEPAMQLQAALGHIAGMSDTRLVAVSPFYRSRPMGPQDQPAYVNAVAGLLCSLDPLVLLNHLLAIEETMGRLRDGERWGPRIIDLDLLMYGAKTLQDDRLTLPHPGVHERSFVLYPLADIAPTISIPGRGRVELLRAAMSADGIERLEESPSK
jgi:2-amino-4-hydroxy-6-hydroxymethyldihydropteridine diphosphokinase